MNRRTIGIMAIVVFGLMMPVRYYLQEQQKKEREEMLYELSKAASEWQRAVADSMMQDLNRQQMESLTASMEDLDKIGRSLDALGSSIAKMDTTAMMADLPVVKGRSLPDPDTDDPLGIKAIRADLAAHPTPERYLDAGIKEEVYKNFDQAKKDYQAAIELDQKNGAAMFQLAKLHLKLGEVAEAEKLAEQCEKYEPSFANGIRKEIRAYRKDNP